LEDYDRLRKAELEYYEKYAPLLVEEPPISSVVQPRSLARPEYLLEIEAVGVINRNEPGWEVKKYLAHVGHKKVALSKAVTVGNLIFCSSVAESVSEPKQIPLESQLITGLDNLRVSMEEAGTSMNNIIKIVKSFNGMGDLSSVKKNLEYKELEYYRTYAPLLVKEPPCSVFVFVKPCGSRNMIEIDAVGVISKDKSDWEVKKYYLNVNESGANSIVVNNLVFLPSISPGHPNTGEVKTGVLEEQMTVVLDKIRMAMEKTGSSMNNIIKTTMYLKNLEDYARMRKNELEYYKKYAPLLVEEPPASTFVQPYSLSKPEYLIEIEAVGFRP